LQKFLRLEKFLIALTLTLSRSEREREQQSKLSLFLNAHPANTVTNVRVRRNIILPLLGERAGVRENW